MTRDVQEFIAKFKDSEFLLILCTAKCKFSQRLLEEMKIATTLTTKTSPKTKIIHVYDVGETLPDVDWLPGVPLLMSRSQIHLGVDAFSKLRNFSRAEDGIKMMDFG